MADRALERLKLLYDYEKFHIGLYGALMTGFIAILGFGNPQSIWMRVALGIAILSLLVAAICGAILASSVIDVYGNYGLWSAETDDEAGPNSFWRKKIGPSKGEWWETWKWWRLGHGAFWTAVFLVVGSFLAQLIYRLATGQIQQ
jgi:hypothetical protein